MKVEMKGVTRCYQNKQALNVESLIVKSGTFLGVIGPNGAGKSTLAKIVGGIESLTTGQVFYNDQPPADDMMKKTTMIFQKPYLLRTTVFQNIAYPLVLRRISRSEIQNRVEEMLEEMEIPHLKEQKAWTLSGGEAQKVALARALIFKPSLLVLDEATANLDPASMLVIEKNIQKYYEAHGATVMMVTHNIRQAQRLCTEIAFMNQGIIEEMGAAEDLIHHPKHQRTQKFVLGEIVV